jgi:hypothetical protein
MVLPRKTPYHTFHTRLRSISRTSHFVSFDAIDFIFGGDSQVITVFHCEPPISDPSLASVFPACLQFSLLTFFACYVCSSHSGTFHTRVLISGGDLGRKVLLLKAFPLSDRSTASGSTGV